MRDLLYGALGSSHHADLPADALADYYHGSQPLSYLSPETRQAVSGRIRTMVLNLPRLVVDSIEDRLDIEGFRLGGEETSDAELWRIWQANDLDEESQQGHLESLIYGRSYVMVWSDPEDELTPRITVESARLMTVVYDESSKQIVRAVKRRQDDEWDYRTSYDTGWIVRERRRREAGDSEEWELRGDPVQNVLGVVPVVPLVNRPTTFRPQGESEMTDVIPIADAINKLATDMLVTADHYATPRRWATGVDLGGQQQEERSRELARQRWSQAEKDRVWLSDSPNTSFGQFQEAQLDNFVRAIDMLTARAAAVSGLPPHYFGQAGENPASADALRASESSLVKRAQRKQRVLGGRWEQVMRLALLVRDGEIPAEARSMETVWRNAETPTVAQKMDAAVKGVDAGIIDIEQAQEDLGYTPTQIAGMARRRSDAALGPVRAQLDEADRLQREEGLSQRAAFAAVGLLQAAQAIGQ